MPQNQRDNKLQNLSSLMMTGQTSTPRNNQPNLSPNSSSKPTENPNSKLPDPKTKNPNSTMSSSTKFPHRSSAKQKTYKKDVVSNNQKEKEANTR